MSLSGVVWRRAAAQRVVLAAAFATIMLATTVLAMTSLYVQSVGESGLRRALTQAPLGDRTMEVRDSVDSAASLDDRDQQVRRAVGAAFAVVGAEVHASAVSSSYALPTRRGAEVTDLTVFAFYDDCWRRAGWSPDAGRASPATGSSLWQSPSRPRGHAGSVPGTP